MKDTKALQDRILELKKKKNAVIVAHNYQVQEVQNIADFTGDSLELARESATAKGDMIVFCGVKFMAETAKILSPEKKVLLPRPDAGCPMANMITPDDVRKLRKKYPEHTFVAYVNTNADVKTMVDICCTSANALRIVEALPNDKIYFLPDQNLGRWVQTQTSKEILTWDGYCYVHHQITEDDVFKGKSQHPNARIMIHPEAPLPVLAHADAVLSTGQMLRYAEESSAQEFLIGTEEGLIAVLQKKYPDKNFYPLGRRFTCRNMKVTDLQSVHFCLENEIPEIKLSAETIEKARKPIEKMLELSG